MIHSGFNFLAVGGAEFFGFCSLKPLAKLMLSCMKTVAMLLDLLALETLPVFSNLVYDLDYFVAYKFAKNFRWNIEVFYKFSFDFYWALSSVFFFVHNPHHLRIRKPYILFLILKPFLKAYIRQKHITDKLVD